MIIWKLFQDTYFFLLNCYKFSSHHVCSKLAGEKSTKGRGGEGRSHPWDLQFLEPVGWHRDRAGGSPETLPWKKRRENLGGRMRNQKSQLEGWERMKSAPVLAFTASPW